MKSRRQRHRRRQLNTSKSKRRRGSRGSSERYFSSLSSSRKLQCSLFRPTLIPPANAVIERRRPSLVGPFSASRRKSSVDLSPSNRRNQNASTTSFLHSLRHRMSPKTPVSSPNAPDVDAHLPSSSAVTSSPNTNSPPMSSSIPIRAPPAQQPASSLLDYFSSSLSNRAPIPEQSSSATKTTEYSIPLAIPTKKLWISDDDVSVCMCCNETRFSMFNRRHHCRRCGRVVCKPCSQHMTIIKERPERTCKDCYQYMQTNPTPAVQSRPDTSLPNKKLNSLRS